MGLRSGLTLPLLLALLTPAALAQVPEAPPLEAGLEVTLAEPAGEIPANVKVGIPFEVRYDVPPNAGGLTIQLEVAPLEIGWAAVADPDTFTTPGEPTLGGTVTFAGMLHVDHDGRPPAFEPEPLVLRAIAHGDGRAVGAREASGETTVAAAWRSALLVETAASGIAIRSGGGEGTLTAEVRNTGNAPIIVSTTVPLTPRGCEAPTLPADMTLQPGERDDLALTIACENGWTPGTLGARLSQKLASDPLRLGNEVAPSWDIVEGAPGSFAGPGRSFGDPAPNPRNDASWGATLLVPLALVVAAALARRR